MIAVRDGLIFVARLVRVPAILVAIYLFTHALFGSLTTQDGLLTPEGAVNPGVFILGAWVLLLRLVVVFVLPTVLAYRIVTSVLRRLRNWLRIEPEP
jgi:hypothetical protein